MANEAVIIELLGIVPGRPFRQGVADATAVPKGTIMKITDQGQPFQVRQMGTPLQELLQLKKSQVMEAQPLLFTLVEFLT